MRNVALFDFDGTVIDGSEGIWKCINHATDKMGLPRATQAVLDSFIGPSLYDSFVKHYENDPDRANLFIAYYRERYSVTGKYECGLYPGIRDLLRDLNNDGFRLAVCSSKPLEFVKDIAAHLGVFDAFAYYSCPSFRDNVSNKTALATACLRFFGAGYVLTALTDGALTFDAACRGYLSVFSFSDKSEGVTLNNLAYTMENGTMTNTFGLGVSNEFTGKAAGVSVKKGTLLLMYQRTEGISVYTAAFGSR